MEQNNKQQSEYMGFNLEKGERKILEDLEVNTIKRACFAEKLLTGDLSTEKTAAVLIRCFISFMSRGRGDMFLTANENLEAYDKFLRNLFEVAIIQIKEGSEIYCRTRIRYDKLKETTEADKIDVEAIINEEREKYYAEKKDNDPEAD